MGTEQLERTPEYAEKHYTVAEVAAMWMLSEDFIRKLFEREPDVLVLKSCGGKMRRTYRTLRIPAFVLERVHKRLKAE
jgi:hypothetical protein